MNATRSIQDRALLQVMVLLDKAASIGAAGIDLTPGAAGLEVSYRTGQTSVGALLADRELEREMLSLLVRRAGLEDKRAGLMPWQVLGQVRKVAVFQETGGLSGAFRLRFQGLPQTRRKPVQTGPDQRGRPMARRAEFRAL